MPLPDVLKLLFALIFTANAVLIWWITKPVVMYYMYHSNVKLTVLSIRKAHNFHKGLVLITWLISIFSLGFWR